eukprot:TRINITY_DN43610_c0_g1_i1.p1 TRINITY_DN43610_c0_g1~~TRINITY_DN43610_c0_g1_i1.p1  ORF type:complete len:222 (+),score=19.56 TRINITY_DN43610_c0_g1_i1:49-714(+)
MENGESSQQSALHLILPLFAVLFACNVPCMVLLPLRTQGSRIADEARNTLLKPLSVISLLVILLSPFFLLSDYSHNSLYTFAVYSLLLAAANLLADKLRRPRAWPVLLIWHFFNLLYLLTGSASLFPIFSAGDGGLISAAFHVSGPSGESCSSGWKRVDWCNDVWITAQILAAYVYVAVHCIAFFVVGVRVVKFCGGDENGVTSRTDNNSASLVSENGQPF